MQPADAELHGVQQRGFLPPVGENRKRRAGHRTIITGPHDRVIERSRLLHQRDCTLKVAFDGFALLQGAPPEGALVLAPRRKASTTGRVIFPSRKSSPMLFPSLACSPE